MVLRLGGSTRLPVGDGPDFAHGVDIIVSIEKSGVAHQLVFKHSMHDLWIAAAPIRPGATEYIHLHAPNSLRAPRAGHVLIEHRSFGGRDDRIERPTSESVSLFWRFAEEKFGIVAKKRKNDPRPPSGKESQ